MMHSSVLRSILVMGTLGTVVVIASACSEDDPAPGGGQTSSSGSTSSASSSGSTSSASSSGSTSSSSSGGADASTSSSSGSSSSGGLLAGDGITGKMDGKTFLAEKRVARVPQQTQAVVIGASTADVPPYDSWTIRFKPEIGTQPCAAEIEIENTSIQFGSFSDPSLSGTTASPGSCSITVTSIDPKFEGTFTAKIHASKGDLDVTDGAFRVPK